MPAVSATACAKLILLGEHAVVYGEPALAVPFSGLRARAAVEAWIGAPSGRIHIFARDLDLDQEFSELPENNLIRSALLLVLTELGIDRLPTCKLHLTTEIPISAGLGASAALAVAVMRAFSAFLGHPLAPERLNSLAFQSEQLMHGTPSGIDNTVVVYEQPILFQKSQGFEVIKPAADLHFLVADSGVKKATALTVRQLAQDYARNPGEVGALIKDIGQLTLEGVRALTQGDFPALAEALNANQELLTMLGLSCPELDTLLHAARDAGAAGAKLTGGGKGGHMLALIQPEQLEQVRAALLEAGAPRVYHTVLKAEPSNA
ncbi:MAG: mevalonate kinase [Chloroflexi bacterium]|jgi:mevalonate kinase|nr:mevalonate kinase [Anaerolineaceae bacterium]NLI44123.1 mevalonate kinase [Chloroflexota bacterium]HOE34636.1 mevalonate kinase [Anaerolineaceae bacterium]HOT24840.1 mevalonate kinase [Anaerolineaceae bacterium]HQH57609.1 mevalonate kinase [Anaerolineaceae bacterium]